MTALETRITVVYSVGASRLCSGQPKQNRSKHSADVKVSIRLSWLQSNRVPQVTARRSSHMVQAQPIGTCSWAAAGSLPMQGTSLCCSLGGVTCGEEEKRGVVDRVAFLTRHKPTRMLAFFGRGQVSCVCGRSTRVLSSGVARAGPHYMLGIGLSRPCFYRSRHLLI